MTYTIEDLFFGTLALLLVALALSVLFETIGATIQDFFNKRQEKKSFLAFTRIV